MKTKSQSEPKKLDFSLKGGKPSSLQANQEKRIKRREMMNEIFNKVVADKF